MFLTNTSIDLVVCQLGITLYVVEPFALKMPSRLDLCHLSSPAESILKTVRRGFIKGGALGKLTGCERDLAINLPSCFRPLFLLSFIRKTKNAWLKNPTDFLHKNLMKPLSVGVNFSMACQLNSEVTTHFLNTLIKRFSFVISR